jgi:iron(II)-dependent oxidoreductase
MTTHADATISAAQLAEWVCDARQRTFELIADLTDEQLLGPRLAIVNPMLWEIGHVAWFQEYWVLRQAAQQPPLRPDLYALYNSATVPHDTRWDLPLPARADALSYLTEVRDRVLERLCDRVPDREDIYCILLSVFHEDMHTEAFTYTRQTLGYAAPSVGERERASAPAVSDANAAASRGDAPVPGGTFLLGARADGSFVFDNEKWAHRIELPPFAIARTAVTQREFAEFVAGGGYRHQEWWTPAGWRWRERVTALHPVYWRQASGGSWQRRDFDQWVPLEAQRPVVHVNWYEADAYCRWAGRRLPTEGEWEVAAAGEPGLDGRGRSERKRHYPWGDDPPTPERANLDWRALGCLDVGALPAGDSAIGCRQMIGNIWEWTSSDFVPYPGFVADRYKEYSQPWFGTHKVLRGGCWASRSRLLRNTWRNFYEPHRRDVWAGFRTCAR